jgi:hypothetical protein
MSTVAMVLVSLLVAAAAVWVAGRRDGRQRRQRLERERDDRRRAEAAQELAASIEDADVRDAWPMVCDAVAHGWLDDPAELARRLRAGGGMQLMEEASIDIDDETPAGDRVLLYHAGFDPPRRTCPLAAFLAALDRLPG